MCLNLSVQKSAKGAMALGIYQKDAISLAALRSRDRIEADARCAVRHRLFEHELDGVRIRRLFDVINLRH